MNPPLTEDEMIARDNLQRQMAQIALQCDDTYTKMQYDLRRITEHIGYRVLRGDKLDDPELEVIIEDGRILENAIKVYKANKLKTT
jgi:hypothetical protein